MAGCLAQWPARALRAALVGVLLGAGTHAPAADSSAAIAAFRAGDHGRAVAELRAPAAAGDPAAQFYLGLAYAKGWGVVADAAKARRWYEQAAQAGTAKAQVNLALLLLADGDADGA